MKNRNDFAVLTISGDWNVRFIEIMPFGSNSRELLVSASEIRQRLPGLREDSGVTGFGPARMYRLPGAKGTIAIISPVTDHFCAACNRLRLTADGKLRPCLLHDSEVDLRPALVNGAAPEDLARLILQAVANKPRQHGLAQGQSPHLRAMSQIGG